MSWRVPLPWNDKTATLAPMPGWIGFPELIVLLLVLLLIFGPKRLPEMGRSLGKGMREFKDSITGNDNDRDEQPSLPVAPAEPVASVQSREHDTV
jgi:sec-independent protein translocase protein TatA